ncbi:pilus assembly protein [Azotobacter chroococcum]|uniref:TadE/TadG family type IV pilus assembly protein n=1 Tax=Azotobacter chroococcum TaxID=353 RepID=UPI00103F2309|nr:TadE/TadG family type IV pilus assembly protein [Azotobacter chroococcum]TBW10710.1 pilus assembly protein [Azotobacter chroococcum]
MRRRPLHGFKVGPRRQRGAVLILVVVAMIAILMMAALTLDGGHMLLNKARLQNAVDAAALSGAKTLGQIAGEINSGDTAALAARNTLLLNVADGTGNTELATGISKKGGVANFAKVEFSSSVYGPFVFKQTASSEDRYVRVAVPEYGLAGFFWGFVQNFGSGSLGEKSVAAIATAGPSPTSPCELAPLVVCAKSDDADSAWGFGFGELQVLKTAAGDDSPIGPGNFQLLDLSGDLTGTGGAKTVGQLMAGGGYICPTVGEYVDTKPGNTIGQSVNGLNTRFGIYSGNFSAPTDDKADSEDLYPPDWVVDYTKVENGKGKGPEQGVLALNDDGDIVYEDKPNASGKTDSTDLVEYYEGDKEIRADSGTRIDGYQEWLQQSAACIEPGSNCPGVFGRRILRVVVGDCPEGSTDGKSELEVLGFGCYFVLQPADQSGNSAQIFGQFVETCEGDGVPGPNPATEKGPEIIQLYKTYVDGSPSTDS